MDNNINKLNNKLNDLKSIQRKQIYKDLKISHPNITTIWDDYINKKISNLTTVLEEYLKICNNLDNISDLKKNEILTLYLCNNCFDLNI